MPVLASCLQQVFDLDVEADGAGTRVASQWLAKLAADFEMPDAQFERLDICLNEVLANIIQHGAAAAANTLIHIAAQVSHDTNFSLTTVTVSDAGPAFDITLAGHCSPPKSLAEARPGGLGLLMTRSFADELRYHHSQGQNHLSVVIRWAKSDA